MSHLLTAIWLLPTVGGALIAAFLPRRLGKWTAVLVALAGLVLVGVLLAGFQAGVKGYQFGESYDWIPELHVRYSLGVDSISLWLLALNALITLLAVLATPVTMLREPRFSGLLLMLSGGMAGVLLAADLVLFYVFWEAMLIPAYFLLWLWGEGEQPLTATLKFILFTLAGSLLMLVGVIGEYVYTGSRSFGFEYLAAHPPAPAVQFGLFAAFALAFAIKVPVFPFHGWLRDAYVAAPTPMLLLFAGVMGKTGAYSMLRILVPLFRHPEYWWSWDQVLPWLAIAGIAWGGLMALAATDIKALVAYSSLSHMGFIVLGIFTLNPLGQQGAVVQMVNHGLIVPALFLIVAWLEARAGSRERAMLSGLAPRMPILTGVFLVVTLAALGLPGLNSFVGEFMVLLGAWQAWWLYAVLGCIGLVLAPIYMLRMFQGAMYTRWAGPGSPAPAAQEPAHDHEHATHVDHAAAQVGANDLGGRQLALMAPLVLLMFALGLDPNLLTRLMSAVALGLNW